MQNNPLLLTKGKAMAFIGVGRDLFEAIESDLPFVRIKKSKRYNPEDIKREIENMRRSPCILPHSKTRKIATASIPHSQLMGLGGLEEAVKQTTNGMQTNIL